MNFAHDLVVEPAWTDVRDALPEVGQVVEVWSLVDRTAEEDEVLCGKWHAVPGVLLANGHWLVNGDAQSICSHWRTSPVGPGAA